MSRNHKKPKAESKSSKSVKPDQRIIENFGPLKLRVRLKAYLIFLDEMAARNLISSRVVLKIFLVLSLIF